MYGIVIVFGLILAWCVGAIIVLLVRARRARLCRIDILVRLNKLEFEKKKQYEAFMEAEQVWEDVNKVMRLGKDLKESDGSGAD